MEDVPSTNSANNKRLSCGHAFHYKCIIKWFVTSEDCPTCRCKQSKDTIILFKESVEDELRRKYRDAIRTLEIENKRLNEKVRSLNRQIQSSRNQH
jgi:hypothetical protein